MRISCQPMTSSLARLLCCALIASGWSSTAYGEEPPFTITLSAEQNPVKAGAEVWIKIVVTNSSDQTIYMTDKNAAECEYDAQVWDAQTRTPTRDTEWGIQVKNWPNAGFVITQGRKTRMPPCMIGNSARAMLKPGKDMTSELMISDLFDMSPPGQYTIQLQRYVPNPNDIHTPGHQRERDLDETVKSNMITVTVTE